MSQFKVLILQSYDVAWNFGPLTFKNVKIVSTILSGGIVDFHSQQKCLF